jgi:hypothetical protein
MNGAMSDRTHAGHDRLFKPQAQAEKILPRSRWKAAYVNLSRAGPHRIRLAAKFSSSPIPLALLIGGGQSDPDQSSDGLGTG